MSMTPEQAAEKVVGKYSLMLIAEIYGLRPTVLDTYLREYNIRPCQTCGAYRRADRCEVCEKVEEVS